MRKNPVVGSLIREVDIGRIRAWVNFQQRRPTFEI